LNILNCRNPLLAAHQLMGVLNELSLWPWMMSRKSIPMPADEAVDETIRMFLRHYRGPKSSKRGNNGA
jgi:TetR/AcrR family transcriptional regulator of autoinduction and epiphytic fitness